MNTGIEGTPTDRIADDLRKSGMLLDVPEPSNGENKDEPAKPKADKPKRKRAPKKKAEATAEPEKKEDKPAEKPEEPAKTTKSAKVEFIELGLDNNPKKPGTAAYKRYATMMRFLDKHGGRAPLVEVLDKTDYNRADVRFDTKRKHIRIFKDTIQPST